MYTSWFKYKISEEWITNISDLIWHPMVSVAATAKVYLENCNLNLTKLLTNEL